MRALLVVNHTATATTPRTRDVLVRALASDLKVDVATTGHRGHAAEMARQAAADQVDVVFALGGDGTVNEVINGLLADGPSPQLPHFAVVPGGSANVFARALGLPRDPVEATGQVLDALREGRRRPVGLGRADGRYFAFCAGMGLDAEVVRLVEARRSDGQVATPNLYVRTAVRHFFTGADRRHPALELRRPDTAPVPGLFLGIVANTSPWTYLGERPVDPCPEASFETGLDVFALRRLTTVSTLRHVRQALTEDGRPPRGRDVVLLHDLAEFELAADRPVAVQVDGDYVGERTAVTFGAEPRALRVIV